MILKNILMLSLLFGGLLQANDKGERQPNYKVVYSLADKSIAKTSSMFEFVCEDENNNLLKNATIQYSYNGIEANQTTNDQGIFQLTVKPGKYIFQFFNESWNYYEIYTDSIKILPGYKTKILLRFDFAKIEVISDKPVIYLYPSQKMPIQVILENSSLFTFTYPEYKNGWSVIAQADGTIEYNQKLYNYLFWEGKTNLNISSINWSNGFIVQKAQLLTFLEEKLNQMGFNSKEQQDFITYWYPRMQNNESNYIHFLFNEEYNTYAPLKISPQPDQLFRVYMIWSDAGSRTDLKPIEQKIPGFQRNGFSVLEWGGAEMKNLNHIN